MSGFPKYTTYSDLKLPKYVSYMYVQDAIKKATRDCMYYGTRSPQCKKAWHDVECVEAYFLDKFKKKPQVTRQDADLCKDSYGKDDHDGGRVE